MMESGGGAGVGRGLGDATRAAWKRTRNETETDMITPKTARIKRETTIPTVLCVRLHGQHGPQRCQIRRGNRPQTARKRCGGLRARRSVLGIRTDITLISTMGRIRVW